MPAPDTEDPITEKEEAVVLPTASSASRITNAFTALMTPKLKRPTSPSASPRPHKNKPPFASRDGLGLYILKPETYPSSVVIYYTSDFVAIYDLYPKSTIHTLLLPRSTNYTKLHPFDAFADPEFLSSTKLEAEKLKKIVGKELQRRYGPFSEQDKKREAVLNGEIDAEELPKGRDWEKEVRVGIHARPSMNHLHIHVLSPDRYSECLKYKKHYNSFIDGFFVPLSDFPLAENDKRRSQRGWDEKGLVCWRCGENFGNKFARLKEHLKEEFEAWKRD